MPLTTYRQYIATFLLLICIQRCICVDFKMCFNVMWLNFSFYLLLFLLSILDDFSYDDDSNASLMTLVSGETCNTMDITYTTYTGGLQPMKKTEGFRKFQIWDCFFSFFSGFLGCNPPFTYIATL